MIDERELWEAWGECQAARERWLISDPLRFSEFEVTGSPPVLEVPAAPELDFMTRPKQGGGVRLEVFPDVFASTLLQAAADRAASSGHDFGPALSSRLLGMRLEAQSSYETWSSSVVPWLKRQLSRRRTVLIVDVRDYFGSISQEQIRTALGTLDLDPRSLETISQVIESINATPDPVGEKRSGLPIAPNDFFWVVADLVFGEIDPEIQTMPGIESYLRWIDDLFLALQPAQTDQVLQRLRRSLGAHGFCLNEGKTQLLAGAEDFDKAFLAREHEALDTLFRASRSGFLPTREDYFLSLFSRFDGLGIQQDRVVKRAYSLAAMTGTAILLERAEQDLALHPTAELSILAYLGGLGWPAETIGVVLRALTEPTTDSRLLGTMRMLLRFPPPQERLDAVLGPIVEFLQEGGSRRHPFCFPLALGFALGCRECESPAFLARCLEDVRGLPSATARRVACEVLMALPGNRDLVLELIAEDPSSTVRGLLHLVDPPRPSSPPSRLLGILANGSSQRLSWGGLTSTVARAVLPSELLRDPPPTPRSEGR